MRSSSLREGAVDRSEIRGDLAREMSIACCGFETQSRSIASHRSHRHSVHALIEAVECGDQPIFGIGNVVDKPKLDGAQIKSAHPRTIDVRWLGGFVFRLEGRCGSL